MAGNQVVYLHVGYLIFDQNQQFETIEPIGSEITQAGVINYTIKFHAEVSSDDPANIGGGRAIHVFLLVQNANHLNNEIIAGPPQIRAGPALCFVWKSTGLEGVMALPDPNLHFASFYLVILANAPACETTELVLIARRVLGHARKLRRVMSSGVDIKKVPTPPAQ